MVELSESQFSFAIIIFFKSMRDFFIHTGDSSTKVLGQDVLFCRIGKTNLVQISVPLKYSQKGNHSLFICFGISLNWLKIQNLTLDF